MSSIAEKIITLEKFNGENFHLWKFKMQMLLEEKDLWDYVEKKVLAEADLKKDRKALAIISLSLADSQLMHVRKAKTSNEAWNNLVNHFETKSLANKLFLRKKFFRTEMQESDDMLTHINAMNTLSQQLEAVGAEVSEDDLVITILASLPKQYETLITALETRPEKLTLEFITARLLHEESKFKEQQKSDTSAYVSKPIPPRKPWKPCKHCGKTNHPEWRCFKNTQNGQANHSEFLFHVNTIQNSVANTQDWIVDSGASNHMTCNKEWLKNYRAIKPIRIETAENERFIEAVGCGDVVLFLKNRSGVQKVTVANVYFVPNLGKNLLSIGKISEKGVIVQFSKQICIFKTQSHQEIGFALLQKGLYILQTAQQQILHAVNNATAADSKELWHFRLGHLNYNDMKQLDLPVAIPDNVKTIESCEDCAKCKLIRAPFASGSSYRAKEPLEIVHSDVCGPMKTPSHSGKLYFLTFIDDFSRMVFVYLLKYKSEAFTAFQEFRQMAEKQSGKQLKVLRTDNGGEFLSLAFQQHCKDSGIKRQLTVPYTPQQNGVAERMNRTLVETARTMLSYADLQHKFWAEAVKTAVYLRNLAPTSSNQGKSPLELWQNHPISSINHLRVFGCNAFAKENKQKGSKFDEKGIACVFIGYCEQNKAYRLLDVGANKVIVSRNVVFMENMFTFGRNQPKNEVKIELGEEETSAEGAEGQDEHQGPDQDAARDPEIQLDDQEAEPVVDINPQTEAEALQPNGSRKSSRTRQKPKEWWIASVNSAQIHQETIPKTYQEAIQSPNAQHWKEAMDAEMEALQKNHTWDLCSLPYDRKAIGCRWVFVIKYKATGEIDRYKARLVAKGYSQQPGVDFEETFAPVAKLQSIRVVLALAVQENFEIHQMDVKTAFLNGDLDEEIYMVQPPGYVSMFKKEVCRLNKSLYGLKQSPRCWNIKIHEFLIEEQFKQNPLEHCIYMFQCSEYILIVVVYVDDLLITGNSITRVEQFKIKLSQRFEMSDLGELSYFLGMEFKRDRETRRMHITQQKYTLEMLEKYNMVDSKPLSTPQDMSVKLSKTMSPATAEEIEEMSSVPYRNAVGSLIYLMVATRPDIATAVGECSRFMESPGRQHWTAVKRIFKYLKGTWNYGLVYEANDEKAIVGYSDADWAGCIDDRKSVSGYVFQMCKGSVTWCCKKQATVALSTTEAEYMALAACFQEALWLKQLLEHLPVSQREICIKEDNQSTIAIAKNPVQHSRTKHIDIKYHFIRDEVRKKQFQFEYCASENMVADVLTKPLGRERFMKLRELLGVKCAEFGLSGSVENVAGSIEELEGGENSRV